MRGQTSSLESSKENYVDLDAPSESNEKIKIPVFISSSGFTSRNSPFSQHDKIEKKSKHTPLKDAVGYLTSRSKNRDCPLKMRFGEPEASHVPKAMKRFNSCEKLNSNSPNDRIKYERIIEAKDKVIKLLDERVKESEKRLTEISHEKATLLEALGRRTQDKIQLQGLKSLETSHLKQHISSLGQSISSLNEQYISAVGENSVLAEKIRVLETSIYDFRRREIFMEQIITGLRSELAKLLDSERSLRQTASDLQVKLSTRPVTSTQSCQTNSIRSSSANLREILVKISDKSASKRDCNKSKDHMKLSEVLNNRIRKEIANNPINSNSLRTCSSAFFLKYQTQVKRKKSKSKSKRRVIKES